MAAMRVRRRGVHQTNISTLVGFFVDPAGSDTNAGTSTTVPWRTLAHASTAIAGGSTVYVRASTYAESLIFSNSLIPSGSTWSAVTRFVAYPGETVWMKPSTGTVRVLEFSNGQKYIEFDRINLDAANSSFDCVKINGVNSTSAAHHIRIRNAQVLGNTQSSQTQGSDGNRSAIIMMTQLSTGVLGGNEFSSLTVRRHGGEEGFAHAFYVQSPDNLIEWCDISDVLGSGVQIFNGQVANVADNNIVRYNTIFNLTSNPSTVSHRAVTLGDGRNNQCYGNLIYNIQGPNPLNGGAIFGFAGADHLIINNTVEDAVKGIYIENGCSSVVVRNNIAFNCAQTNYETQSTNTIASNNLFSTANPGFVNASTRDYHLASTSAARNTGIASTLATIDLDAVARPQESTQDIGAYEFVA